ncbi:hypothetical protein ACO0LO_02140 [Undibacterium sp. TJN25]|uniref:hypothetical protein n=1 Tax=Undibacterium sp. TJN25 TaxID=3413056 RepID=UPI003BF0617E
MERKYFFESGNWEEASWVLSQQFPDRFATEADARNYLKNSVMDRLDTLPLSAIQQFEPIVNGCLMALPSAFLQRSRQGDYESIHVHFWQCLATNDYSVVQVHRIDSPPGPPSENTIKEMRNPHRQDSLLD